MKKLVYAMHFTGQTSRHVDDSELWRTTGSATSCVMTTVILPMGVKTTLKASEGELAFLESELRLDAPGTFVESGEVSFGDEGNHSLRFSTLGKGHVEKDLEPGVMAGTASWKIEDGTGQFTGARGFITSNFTINESGERSDFHCGLIFVPEQEDS